MREVILNSTNRVTGSSSDFSLPLGGVKKMKLVWVDIPGTFNNFAGCTLQVCSIENFTIEVPAGRYTLATLVNFLNEKFVIQGHNSYVVQTVFGGVQFVCETTTFTVTGAWDLQNNVSQAISLNEPFIYVCCRQVLGVDNGVAVAGTSKQNIVHAVPCEYTGIKYAPLKSPWVHCFGEVKDFYLAWQDAPLALNGGEWACKLLVI